MVPENDPLPPLDMPADQYNPLTKRWDHALQLCESGITPSSITDPYLRGAVGLIRAAVATQPTTPRRYRIIYDAARIFHKAQRERWLIEALLLGGATPEDIAHRCRIPATIVDCYRALFFDFDPAQMSAQFVFCNLLRRNLINGPEQIRDIVWKVIAYVCGNELFLAWLRPDARFPSQQRKELEQLILRYVLTNLVGAAFQLKPTPETTVPLMARAARGCFASGEQRDEDNTRLEQMMAGLKSSWESLFYGLADYQARLAKEARTPDEQLRAKILGYIIDPTKGHDALPTREPPQ
ncbi:MAG: hypothetical protein JXO22_02580 [Phycisphaerae bacterium]|nr:hypothetical protein [Phycisphaerae bacterium]